MEGSTINTSMIATGAYKTHMNKQMISDVLPVTVKGTTYVEDSYIAENTPQGAYGGGVNLALGFSGSGANKQRYVIIRFKPTLVLPPGVTITTAKIYLYPYSKTGNNDHVCPMYRVWMNWKELNVCWTYWKNSTQRDYWNTAGCQAANDSGPENNVYDRKTTAEDTTTIKDADVDSYVSWDVTSLCQEWINRSASEYGVLIETDQAVSGQWMLFRSSESPETDEVPYLEIT